MYAVIKTGGKQYKVSEGDFVKVEKLPGDAGQDVTLSEVLMVSGADGSYKIGRPLLDGAVVTATIMKQDKHPKILVFHKKRRKGYRKLNGHRQPYTQLKITGIRA